MKPIDQLSDQELFVELDKVVDEFGSGDVIKEAITELMNEINNRILQYKEHYRHTYGDECSICNSGD